MFFKKNVEKDWTKELNSIWIKLSELESSIVVLKARNLTAELDVATLISKVNKRIASIDRTAAEEPQTQSINTGFPKLGF